MKIDLILENIRNQYTLGLLEESTVAGLDEKTVIKGKMLINESTMELRKMLIQEGVLADVRSVLANGFARVIEESVFGYEPGTPDYEADGEAANRATQSFVNGLKNIGNGIADKFHYFNGTGEYKGGNDFNSDAHAKINEMQNRGQSMINDVRTQYADSKVISGQGLLPADVAAARAEAERLANAEAAQQSYNAGLDQANKTAATYAGVGALGAVGAGYGAYRLGQRRR